MISESPDWWICSPKVSIADIHFGILLYRLWLVGFERRMWERNRPNVKRYFLRVQKLDSFQQAVKVSPPTGIFDVLSNPYFLGFLGTTAILGGGYYIWNRNGRHPLDWGYIASYFNDGNKEPSPPPALRTSAVPNKGLPYAQVTSGSSKLYY